MTKSGKILIASRTFTLEDQNDFAKFSGDFNPIHLNEKESIKTHAGQPIVHGVHIALWVLDVFEIKLNPNHNIDISFKSQVNLNEEIYAAFDTQAKRILVTNSNNHKIYSEIIIKEQNDRKNLKLKDRKSFFITNNLKPDEPDIHQIQLEKKDYDLYGGNMVELGKVLFPFSVNNIGLNIIYEIACISSIVGMKIPGKHSLFLNLIINFSIFCDEKNYLKVCSKHEKLKLITLSYFGKNLKADIKAIFRPKPAKTKSVNYLIEKYKDRGSLKASKILVIGGSRGIGAYVTKLCSIMGADVTFTFNSNIKDAQNILKEISASGGSANIYKLNVINFNNLDKMNVEFDQVYYFATPKISPNISEKVDFTLKKNYRLFYVDAFERILTTFMAKNKNTKFLYPSTTYISDHKSDFKEYIEMKLQGEDLCKEFIEKKDAKIFYPRIPPLDTDQNLSIIPSANAKSSDYAYELVKLVSNN